jgi:hypothetical protein
MKRKNSPLNSNRYRTALRKGGLEESNSTLERIYLHNNYKSMAISLMGCLQNSIARQPADGLEKNMKNSLKVCADFSRFQISHIFL